MNGRSGSFVLALCAGAVGAVIGTWIALDTNTAPATTQDLTIPLAKIHAELQGLRRDLIALRQLPVAPSTPTDSRSPARSPEPILAPTLDSLEQAVLEMTAAADRLARTAGGRSSPEVVARETDYQAIAAVADSLPENGPIDPVFFGMTPAQVGQRFGAPTRVLVSDGKVYWSYRNADNQRLLSVSFIDGYVVNVSK
jgi:hypothetical protein